MALALRGGGEVAGVVCVQRQPSQVQVSPSGPASPRVPPKRTTFLLVASYVIEAAMRPGGGAPPGLHGDAVADGVTVRACADGELPLAVEVQLDSISAPIVATTPVTFCAMSPRAVLLARFELSGWPAVRGSRRSFW